MGGSRRKVGHEPRLQQLQERSCSSSRFRQGRNLRPCLAGLLSHSAWVSDQHHLRVSGRLDMTNQTSGTAPPDRSDEYRARDLFAEGEWPSSPDLRFGGVIFNGKGEVLLREPKGYFGGYHWTFPKGSPDGGEAPVDTALRETLEETGHRPIVIGHVPGVFKTKGGSWNCFFLMLDAGDERDVGAMNGETSDLRWVTQAVAIDLIGETTLASGKARDLEILDAAYRALAAIGAGHEVQLAPREVQP